MATVDSLRTHLVEELTDLLSAEEQLTEALPQMAQSASDASLKRAFQKHLGETERHLERVKQALRSLGETPKSKTCEAMEGLLEEGQTMMKSAPEGPLRDAVMITGAQKVEHYEIASYGTVRTYARVLGETDVAELLQSTLDEEKAADEKLTEIAERSVNQRAAQAWASQSEEPGLFERVGEIVGTASRQLPKVMQAAKSSPGSRHRAASKGTARQPYTPGREEIEREAVQARRQSIGPEVPTHAVAESGAPLERRLSAAAADMKVCYDRPGLLRSFSRRVGSGQPIPTCIRTA